MWPGEDAIAMIDHRRQGRRFSRTGGADDEHHAAVGHDDFLEGFRQAERREIRHLPGMVLMTMPTFNCWTKTLTRKRATPGIAIE